MGAIFLHARHLLCREVGDADPAHFPLFFEFIKGFPALFQLRFGVGPVDLVEIDDVDAESTQ